MDAVGCHDDVGIPEGIEIGDRVAFFERATELFGARPEQSTEGAGIYRGMAQTRGFERAVLGIDGDLVDSSEGLADVGLRLCVDELEAGLERIAYEGCGFVRSRIGVFDKTDCVRRI